MSEKHKQVCSSLNYFEHFLIFVLSVSVCVSISAFASLTGFPVGLKSSAVELKIYAIPAGIKKCNLIINKKRKNHDKCFQQKLS